MSGHRRQGWRLAVKRLIDVVAAAVALLVLSPLLAVVAVLIRLVIGSPVLFRQMRPGFRAKPFPVVKFRTMTNAVDAEGSVLPDEQRMAWLGRLLRTTSVDELPQLWNVLRGDMSLVGPRPLLMQYIPRYTPEQARRHDVMPGITGWAQVNGRNAVSWNEKFRLDLWYVDQWSLGLDARILIATARRVLTRHGVSSPGSATMTEFMGGGDQD